MPRFVILRHEMPAGAPRKSHWDFMLESGPALRTWTLADEPACGIKLVAETLADHRLTYLDYEGPLTADRGAVTRWDEGSYEKVEETATTVIVSLSGKRLAGLLTLEKIYDAGAATSASDRLIAGPPSEDSSGLAQRWLFSLSAVNITSA